MSIRIDSCRVRLTIFADFEGYTGIDFCLPLPIDPDDPLIVMILERNRQLIEAAERNEPPPDVPDIFRSKPCTD